jgi:hypothetical protein
MMWPIDGYSVVLCTLEKDRCVGRLGRVIKKFLVLETPNISKITTYY